MMARTAPKTLATALAGTVLGLTAALSLPASAQEKAAGDKKQLSENSVITLMNYAWTVLPAKFTTPERKTIEVDKSKRDAMIPVAAAWDIIKAGNLSAQAQVCDLWEDQVANYDALMMREQQKKQWSEQQLLYISTLHRMTIHMAAGKLRVVDKPNDETQIFLEPIESSKSGCTDAQKQTIKDNVEAYVRATPGITIKSGPPPPVAVAPAPATPASQPVPAAAQEPKKK